MKTVLIVDDNAEFRGILKELFKEGTRNYKFIESSDPIDALSKLHNKDVDIVLCDLFLPVQNGNDFLEIVKRNRPAIKCLLVSGDAQVKERRYAYVDSTFSKLDLNELIIYLNKIEYEL